MKKKIRVEFHQYHVDRSDKVLIDNEIAYEYTDYGIIIYESDWHKIQSKIDAEQLDYEVFAVK